MWENIKTISMQWKELDRFQHVNMTVDWEKGRKGNYMHPSYYIKLSSSKNPKQAQKCKNMAVQAQTDKLAVTFTMISDFQSTSYTCQEWMQSRYSVCLSYCHLICRQCAPWTCSKHLGLIVSWRLELSRLPDLAAPFKHQEHSVLCYAGPPYWNSASQVRDLK